MLATEHGIAVGTTEDGGIESLRQTAVVVDSGLQQFGGVEEHVASTHILEIGVLTEGHIQTHTRFHVNDVTWEPAHTLR